MTVKRGSETTYEVVDDQAVIVDARRAELVTLNPVGTVVWEALDGTKDIEAIAAEMAGSGRFDGVPRARLEADIRFFLDELTRSGLAE